MPAPATPLAKSADRHYPENPEGADAAFGEKGHAYLFQIPFAIALQAQHSSHHIPPQAGLAFGQGKARKSLQQHSFTLQALCEVGTYLKAHETQITLQGCPSPSFECPGLLTEHPSYCN